jgi:hypothetical protein
MSEDLIKRSDAIDMINEAFDIGDCFCDRYGLIGAFQTIPIAGRPQGKWINQHENGHGFWVGTCNQCSKENRVNNFCPYCGAQMKGEDDEV